MLSHVTLSLITSATYKAKTICWQVPRRHRMVALTQNSGPSPLPTWLFNDLWTSTLYMHLRYFSNILNESSEKNLTHN